jgi:hypothetical protein
MISLILPYWDRQQAADIALDLLAQQYADLDIEVVVVDDGNRIPFKVPDLPLKFNIITLPFKDAPKCPATAWNAGVAASTGDIVALSCVEILHTNKILDKMESVTRAAGDDAYVLAAVYCPDQKKWHCHSSVAVPGCPDGTGIAFLGTMHRELWDRAGGFDEDYRDGAGYEDRDFIHRMVKAGANFIIADELVVIHPKRAATIRWEQSGFARNEAIFKKRWANA